MGLILTNVSASAASSGYKMAGAAGAHTAQAMLVSGAAAFQPPVLNGKEEQSFLQMRDFAPDAAYIFSGTVGGANKTVFFGDVIISGSLTRPNSGGAVDGSGTATELTYWTDTDTIGGITNFTSDGTNVTKLTTDATADILLESSYNSATAIKLLTNAGTTEQIVITNTLGNSAAAIDINATAGGVDIDAGTAIDILAATTLSAKGATGASFGDDTGTWEFDGSGAVSETGMTSLSATPSGAITLTAGAASVWSASAGDVTVDSTAGSLNLTGGEADAAAVRIQADNAAGGIDVDAGTGGIAIDTTGAFSVDGAAASNISVASGEADENLTVSVTGATASSLILSSAGTGADAIDINATAGGMDVDVAGALDIDANDDSAIAVTASGKDLALTVSGGSTQVLQLNSAGTGTDAIDINATAGGVDIDANGAISIDSAAGSIDINVVDGQSVKLGLNGACETIITPHGTAGSEVWSTINTSGDTDGADAAGAILLSSVAGGMGLAWADAKDLWAEGGSMMFVSNENKAASIQIHADGGAAQTIHLLADTSTVDGAASAGAIDIEATAGGIGLTWADDKDLWAEGGQVMMVANHDAANAIKLHADAGASQTIVALNDAGTAEGAITLTSTAGGVDIDAAAAKDVNVAGGQVKLVSKDDAAGAISLTAAVGTSETIVVTNTAGTGNDAITLTATAGGITATVADEKTLRLGNAASDAYFMVAASGTPANEDVRVVNTAGTDEAAIALTATAGGVDIDAAAAKDVNVAGGQVALVSKDDAASAISLTANVGTSETIVVTNTQGTDTAAIALTASAGGIKLSSAADITLDANGADWIYDDGGTNILKMSNDSTNVKFSSQTNDKDITFQLKSAGPGNYDLLKLRGASAQVASRSEVVVGTSGGSDGQYALIPGKDNAYDCGGTSYRWRNIYTGDLHLANARGNYTLVEEEDMLTIRNNRSGKWFKLMMEEIDPTGRDEGMQGPAPVLADSPDWEI